MEWVMKSSFYLTAIMMLGTLPSLANTCNSNEAQQEMCQCFQKSVHKSYEKQVVPRKIYLCYTDLQSADSVLVPDNFVQLQRPVFFNPNKTHVNVDLLTIIKYNKK